MLISPNNSTVGSLYSFFLPENFVASQAPFQPTPLPLPASTHVITLQLGYVYLLLMLLGVAVMYTTSEPRVLRHYLMALGVADWAHIYCVYMGLGWKRFFDVASWNALTWGNIGVTAFLHLNRVGYLLGFLGRPSTSSTEASPKPRAP